PPEVPPALRGRGRLDGELPPPLRRPPARRLPRRPDRPVPGAGVRPGRDPGDAPLPPPEPRPDPGRPAAGRLLPRPAGGPRGRDRPPRPEARQPDGDQG